MIRNYVCVLLLGAATVGVLRAGTEFRFDRSGWQSENGVVRSRDNSAGGTSSLWFGDPAWTDCQLKFRVRRTAAAKGDQHWGVSLRGGKAVIYTRGDALFIRIPGTDVNRVIGKRLQPVMPTGENAPWEHYEVTCRGNSVTVVRNREVAGEFSGVPFGAGESGFYAYRNRMEFDRVAVSGAANPAPEGETNWLGVSRGEARRMEALLAGSNSGLARPVSDREFWASYPVSESLLRGAEARLNAPAPVADPSKEYDFELNKEFSRGVCRMTVAEARENQGRYLNRIAEYLENWCAMRRWTSTPSYAAKNVTGIDLMSARMIRDIAEAYWILGDRLPEQTRETVRRGMEKWCFEPMREAYARKRFSETGPGVFWLRESTNWNPFCQIGVLHAAMIFLDREERAWFLANAAASLDFYDNAFSEDGYIVEGAHYFINMGFSRYLECAELFSRATGGRFRLIADDGKAKNVFRYLDRFSMDRMLHPHFADSGVDGLPVTIQNNHLAQMDLMGGVANYRRFWREGWNSDHGLFLSEDLGRNMLAMKISEAKLAEPEPLPSTTFFEYDSVLVCRDSEAHEPKFAFAAKGGYNREDHNHNDLGSFCLSWNNKMVLGDPGYPKPVGGYFSGARYENPMASSYGHPVPVADGRLQAAGYGAFATVLKTEISEDGAVFTLDLRPAYPDAAGLLKLERTFRYSRSERSLTITDEYAFDTPKRFGGALIGYGDFREVTPGKFETGELSIEISSTHGDLSFRPEILDVEVSGKEHPRRLGYESGEWKDGTVRTGIKLRPGLKTSVHFTE